MDYWVPEGLRSYVNCIMIGEQQDPKASLDLPIYADGYPGIMYQQAEEGLIQMPRAKRLSELFLYGQTLQPIVLQTEGPYRYVVVQLYPFASKYLLGVDPRKLNDDCYDLLPLEQVQARERWQRMESASDLEGVVQEMYALMEALIAVHQVPEDDRVQQAIRLILDHGGRLPIAEVLDRVAVTERTLERQFLAQVGLSPKQFAKIVHFQQALSRLQKSPEDKLVEVGLDSGFADQSHFIRTFKKYTGQTPSYYLKHGARA